MTKTNLVKLAQFVVLMICQQESLFKKIVCSACACQLELFITDVRGDKNLEK
jgi:hypothetical protein